MKGKTIILSLMLLLGTGMASAQTSYTAHACTYVKQNSAVVTNDGCAAFGVSTTRTAHMSFDASGNAIMTIDDATYPVARLTTEELTNGGSLAADFTSTAATVSRSVDSNYKYATIYSPFQLQVPSTGDNLVYAPTYDSENYVLKLTSDTKISNGAIVPPGTTLILASNVAFTFAEDEPSNTYTSALSGSAVKFSNPTCDGEVEGKTVYTFGQAAEDNSKYGFFRYTGTDIYPSYAYLYVSTVPTTVNSAKYVAFSFDEMSTAITNVGVVDDTNLAVKCIDNGQIVIVKNGKKYNLNGQEVK